MYAKNENVTSFTMFLLQSMHMLLHRPAHDGDFLTDSHRLRPQYVAGGSPNQGELAVKHKGCRKTHSLGSPSEIHGTEDRDTCLHLLHRVQSLQGTRTYH